MGTDICIAYQGIDYGLYKLGTFIVLFLCIISLIGIHLLCPLRWNRKMFIKSISEITNKRKKKKRNFFDTRSISANTEFEFTSNNTDDGVLLQQQHPRPYPSILKTDPKQISSPRSEMHNGGAQTLPRNMMTTSNTVRQAEYLMDNKDGPLNAQMSGTLPSTNRGTRKSASFNALPINLSSSRGQLRDRRASVVTFELDSSTRQTKYNTATTEKQRSRKGLELSLNHNLQQTYFCEFGDENDAPNLTKRYSSSQDLVSSGGENTESSKPKQRRYSAYDSVPDFNAFKKRSLAANGVQKNTTNSDFDLKQNSSSYKVTDQPTSNEDTDEGQMQCIFEYDRVRSILIVKGLQVQAIFPPGVPGFLVEIVLVPKVSQSYITRSKVYVTVQQQVDVRIEEIFQLQCDQDKIEDRSIVITVVPILGNVVLLAETELNELNLLENGEIFLGGLLKGVYTKTY